MKSVLDNVGKRLLIAIQLDGRITNQDLADSIGVSPSPCLQRRKRLEDTGVIDCYETRIDLSKVTQFIEVISEITLNTNKGADERDFESYIANIPEMTSCRAVTGSVDYFATFVAPDIRHYQTIVDRMTDELGTIETVTSHVVYEHTKKYTGLPLTLLLDD
ncbi:Lrp/AsnC family transcriptional regulator [Hyphomonas oceanitis]|uniref:AsnC family transcriptional regulator n=1 Tax=Hyphomonas oceanitis SCH89 TaxID=1280953 RepID=A0A059G3K1_9PROT|nr:Lrp/AsnC family transcriptional regulator [Hyphomonas oceanitis]KDA01407.1 AsnC family transcriptional regulator [Hyphomonas oceanitis SCH89]MDE0811036.1 Lrp/AsnC family transcriptional regulator [Alphaproteobacteria bacterium]